MVSLRSIMYILIFLFVSGGFGYLGWYIHPDCDGCPELPTVNAVDTTTATGQTLRVTTCRRERLSDGTEVTETRTEEARTEHATRSESFQMTLPAPKPQWGLGVHMDATEIPAWAKIPSARVELRYRLFDDLWIDGTVGTDKSVFVGFSYEF